MMNNNSTPHSANDYDREIIRTLPFYLELHEETIGLVRTVRPDVATWLDTGCGTGLLAELAIPAFPGTGFVLADPSSTMLERARERLRHVPPGKIRFLDPVGSAELNGEMCDPPQVISAIQCHHYGGAEARRAATRSCYAMLEAGGLYITFENIRPATARGVEVGLDRWCAFQIEAGRPPEAVAEHRQRFGRKYFPITVAEHLQLLTDTGFSSVELFRLSHLQAGFYAIK